jgi:hypothetical protein
MNNHWFKKSHPFLVRCLALLAVPLLLSSCGKGGSATPTLSMEQIQTQAVGTFAAGLTQTEVARPTSTPTPTATDTPTPTASFTPTASPTVFLVLPTDSCYSLAFVKDVSIPDETKMNPGQSFTKTWRVKNNGSCDWEIGYKLKLISGDAMGGLPYSLAVAVKPGETLDISIAMTAPSTTGNYTGNWRMFDDEGAQFGDNVYVKITVAGGITVTTAPPTATQTPTVKVLPSDTPES